MFQRCNHRAGHYALLLLVTAGLYLVNLGGPSLWDIDEGNNAEAAREMMARQDFVVPSFNFQLRVDKPALLYWLQAAAYRGFGVNEFAARLPSALAAMAAVLFTYELGRLLFGALAGLWAGLVLASTTLFTAAAHFANPDALLNAFTTLALLAFWRGFARSGRGWFFPAAVSSALAFLAKGPVGLVLPLGVVGVFLLWTRQLRRLWDWRLLLGALVFLLVALPWYVWVGVETKGEFLRGFFLTHNRDRFLSPMENHSGPAFYYLLVLIAGFTPWSVFLGPAFWYGLKQLKTQGTQPSDLPNSPERRQAFQFLWSWIGVYFVFFSLSGTKLPNYILPLYAPTALVLADFLERWRCGDLRPAGWMVSFSLACLALLGVGVLFGLLLAGGVLPWHLLRGRHMSGLQQGACLGFLLAAGAAVAWRAQRRQRLGEMLVIVVLTAVLFTGTLAAWGGSALDPFKAPRALAEDIQTHRQERDIRVGCLAYFQPSLVFYARREVVQFALPEQAFDFLRSPLQSYLILPEEAWEILQAKAPPDCLVIGRHQDMYRHCAVIVVANR